MLADDAAVLRGFYQGLEEDAVEAYLELHGSAPALGAALNWYRANLEGRRFSLGRLLAPVTVPTLYVWSSGDAAVCQDAAETTADFVTGLYGYEVIDEIGHFIPEEASDAVTQLILEQLDVVSEAE